MVKESEKLSIKVRDSALFFDELSYQVIAKYGKLTTDLSIEFYVAAFGAWDKSKEPDYPALFKSFDTECPGRCKSEPPYRPNSEPGMEAAGAGPRAVDEFSLRV